ncbi:glycoside hydrolase family 13 protein, partial [Moniliophthora roreri]
GTSSINFAPTRGSAPSRSVISWSSDTLSFSPWFYKSLQIPWRFSIEFTVFSRVFVLTLGAIVVVSKGATTDPGQCAPQESKECCRSFALVTEVLFLTRVQRFTRLALTGQS